MKAVLIVLVVASALVGCSTHARHAGGGSAFPREAYQDPLIRELLPDSERDRSRYWSVRDFTQPRGLFQ